MTIQANHCPVCGSDKFISHDVLWDELVRDWGLTPYEESYINRQQGCCCKLCGNNLRSLAIADAILRSYEYPGNLTEFVNSNSASNLRVLEINEAGTLTPIISKLSMHRIIRYPDHDIASLNIASNSYDLIVHSDTLEHVPHPIIGLSECFRVLNHGGRCIFTVPLVIGRLSRSREGLKDSFHGNKDELARDYIVYTEFGSDIWRYVIEAGFSEVRIHSFEYPAALAIEAIKHTQTL